MNRSLAFGSVVVLMVLAMLPAMQSSGAVHEEPSMAIPGTWYILSATDQYDFDFLPVTTAVSQNGVEQTRTWDPKDMTVSVESRTHGGNDTWAYRVYGSYDVDAYINWMVLNKQINATGPSGPGISFGFLVREVGLNNITVTISGMRGGNLVSEVFQIRCAKMEHAMINLSRFVDNTVYFDAYPDSISSVPQNGTAGLYGLGFTGNVRIKVLGAKGLIVDTQVASSNYVAAYNWFVKNETKVGFYNVTMEGTDLHGNATTLQMELEVTPPVCPTWPRCLQIPTPRHHDNTLEQLKVELPIIIVSIVAVVLFTRLKRNSLLNQAMRARIYASIEKEQGIHFHALMRALEVKPGVLSHHINILEKEKFIKSLQDGSFRRFFLYETNAELRVSFNKIQEKILELVHRSPGIFQKDISREIGSSGFVTNYHVRILRDAGMVMLEKDGKNLRCFPTATP